MNQIKATINYNWC